MEPPAPVVIDTFWAVLIAASNWLTRCEIGAVEPTHGQLATAAPAGAAVPAPPRAANAAAAAPAGTRAPHRRRRRAGPARGRECRGGCARGHQGTQPTTLLPAPPAHNASRTNGVFA